MITKNTPKIFIGPTEIAGYYANLTKGLKALGISCDYITYEPHPFGYGGETRRPLLIQLIQWFKWLRMKPDIPFILRVIYRISVEVLRVLFMISVLFRYDVFIFGFGQTLLQNNYDLPILKLLGKTVISNLSHGADARPAYVCGAHQSKEGVSYPLNYLKAITIRVSNTVSNHFKYANVVIGAPFSTSQFASAKFINSFAIGIPMLLGDNSSKSIVQSGVCTKTEVFPVRILHSPSHPAVKGSPIIIQVIERLREKGYEIDFISIHGRPFNDVLEEIQKCDFVVDQLYSDTPMAGFASESAWFGKPAVVGGCGLDKLKQFVPEGMWPQSKTCHPDRIEQAIEELIVDVEQRERLGREAQAFVREKYHSVEVAKRYLRLIEGDIPDDWWLDPKDVTYLEGGGQSVERSNQVIRELVAEYGVSALQLSHRPDLQAAFLEFVGLPSQTEQPHA